MDERAPPNECFFIRLVVFTITLVYSGVWNQSTKKINFCNHDENDAADKDKWEVNYDEGGFPFLVPLHTRKSLTMT